MLRILICLCFINIVLFQSCRSGYTAIEENEEKTIKLSTPTKEVYSVLLQRKMDKCYKKIV